MRHVSWLKKARAPEGLVVLWSAIMMLEADRITVSVLVLALSFGLAGCDKVQQCNKLINTINAHTPKLAAATEKFGEVQANPSVADDYEKAVQAAADEISGLELDDEKVVGFAERYKALLERAKQLGPAMKTARTDPEQLQKVVADADDVKQTEDALVAEVNAYCGGEG
jgi:DNA repair ATPase RecN